MKIAKTEKVIIHIFRETLINFNEIFEKNVSYDDIKSD